MKKVIILVFAIALIFPALASARPNHGHHNPGINAGNWNHGGHHNPGHNNGGHYNPGHNNGGHNNGGHYNPGHNNGGHHDGGHYNPGHNHGGNNGHHNNYNKAEIRRAHRAIKRAFQQAENNYYPFLMNHKDKRRMGRALRTINYEIGNLMRLVRRSFRDDLRQISRIIERARFTLISENDPRGAHNKVNRAERKYNRLVAQYIGR
jgi:hypothetical protein